MDKKRYRIPIKRSSLSALYHVSTLCYRFQQSKNRHPRHSTLGTIAQCCHLVNTKWSSIISSAIEFRVFISTTEGRDSNTKNPAPCPFQIEITVKISTLYQYYTEISRYLKGHHTWVVNTRELTQIPNHYEQDLTLCKYSSYTTTQEDTISLLCIDRPSICFHYMYFMLIHCKYLCTVGKINYLSIY